MSDTRPPLPQLPPQAPAPAPVSPAQATPYPCAPQQPPYQQQPQYPQQPGQGLYPQAPQPPMNTMAIVATIGGFVVPIAGIVCGHISLSQIKRTHERGRGLALTGAIVGYAYTGLMIVLVGVLIAVSAASVSTVNSALEKEHKAIASAQATLPKDPGSSVGSSSGSGSSSATGSSAGSGSSQDSASGVSADCSAVTPAVDTLRTVNTTVNDLGAKGEMGSLASLLQSTGSTFESATSGVTDIALGGQISLVQQDLSDLVADAQADNVDLFNQDADTYNQDVEDLASMC